MTTVTRLTANVTRVLGNKDLAVYKKDGIWIVRDRIGYVDLAHEPTKEDAISAAKKLAN